MHIFALPDKSEQNSSINRDISEIKLWATLDLCPPEQSPQRWCATLALPRTATAMLANASQGKVKGQVGGGITFALHG